MNEYERLKRAGMTEEEIALTTPLEQIVLNDAPLGKDRFDKGVTVQSEEQSKRTSSIMMGYNQQKVDLKNGAYISLDEVMNSLNSYLKEHGENKTIISKRTGKKVSQGDLMKQVRDLVRKGSTLLLGGPSLKITNQDSRTISVKGAGKKEYLKKGLLMLGQSQFQLPSGEYISKEELDQALSAYTLVKPDVKKVPQETPSLETSYETSRDFIPRETPTRHRVVKRVRKKWKLWPVITSAVMLALSAMGMKPSEEVINQITEKVSKMEFTVDAMTQEDVLETEAEALQRAASDFEIGGLQDVKSGVSYYESSDYDMGGANLSGTFGEGLRDVGKYEITKISVFDGTNRIRDVEEKGIRLDQLLEEISKQVGVPANELTVRVHLGGPVSGWVDITDLLSEQELTPQKVGERTVLDEQYTGTVSDLQRELTLQTDHGMVRVPIVGEDGKLLKNGSMVRGSDGETYRLTNLDYQLNTYHKQSIEQVPEQITIRLENMTRKEVFTSIACGILLTALTKEKKTKTEQMTEEEYRALLKKYREKYDSNSKFVQFVNQLHGKSPDWERINIYWDRGLTVDEISKMYDEQGGKKY